MESLCGSTRYANMHILLMSTSIYEAQKAREITRLTSGDDAFHYLQCAVLPIVVLIALVVLVRRTTL